MSITSRSSISAEKAIWIALLAAVILLGLHLRLDVVRFTVIDSPLRSDAADYTAYAYNLERHGVYSRDITTILSDEKTPQPDALRSPGYPVLLTMFVSESLSVFITRTIYMQAVISTLTLLLVALLANRIMTKWPALLVCLLAAISPHLIVANTYVLTETLFCFWVVLMLLVLAWTSGRSSLLMWTSAGIILAIATLTRPGIQYFIIPLALIAWLYNPSTSRLRITILTSLVFITMVSAWSYRNYQTTGQTSDPQLMINGLHHGMYPGFMYNGQPHTYGYPYRFDPRSAEISTSVSRILVAIYEEFRSDPLAITSWFLSKPAYFLQWSQVQGDDIFTYPTIASPYYLEGSLHQLSSRLMKHAHFPLVLLSIFGVIAAFLPGHISCLSHQQRRAAIILSSLYVYFILVHVVVAPFPRYSIPLRPVIYILALLPLYCAFLRIRARTTSHG